MRRLMMICALLVLTGCAGGAAAPSLYRLDRSYPEPLQAAPSRPALVLEPVTVAPYLSDSGIVYQTSAHRIVIARNNRWASPLPAQLAGGLYATLAGTVTGVNIERDSRHTPADAFHLETAIDEFMGHYDGAAHIAGQWTLRAPNGDRLAQRRFERRIPLNRDGYDALVDSLSRGWRQSARALAPWIENAVRRHASSASHL